MEATVMKVEVDAEGCCVCGVAGEELYSPEEHDAGAPPQQVPLRAMLLHLNNAKTVPSGRLCSGCISRALEAYNFSTMLATKGPPPLSEKIRALRKRLHELTQKIDVFIVVGSGAGAGAGGAGAGGAYSEDDIIMVERAALAAADRADRAELLRAPCLRGEPAYHCTVCPATFPRASEYRLHAAAHAPGALHSCWTCGAQFASRAAAVAHAAAHGGARALECHLCSQTFQSQAEQRRHEAGCPARCPVCGAGLPSRASLRAHAAAHATLCGACFRTFDSAAELQAHALAHRQDKQFVCGYDGCILRFASRNNLLAHIRKCHASELEPAPAADVRCEHCARTFASAAAARRHARVHRRAPAQEGSMEWTPEDEAEGRVEYLEEEALEEMEEPDEL